MVSPQVITNCRTILEGLARSGNRITYGALMKRLRIGRHQLSDCLNPIYYAEKQAGRPDLTLIVHYSGSRFGLYNSRGGAAQSSKVVTPHDKQNYKQDLSSVYAAWGGSPKSDLKKWLHS